MDEKEIPSLAEIHIAASHLRSISVPITPILINSILNQLTGRNIYLKCENFQRTGSFTSRGALNAILNAMKIEPNLKGFVAYSSGNHGIAVSYAASLVQRPCVIIVYDNIEKNKINAIKHYGAELVTCESIPLKHIDICSQISKERDYFIVPTSDHPDVIAGN
jgi:threonine dehydratase